MASISKLQETKDGRRYWLIQVSMGKGQSHRKTRFYWPEGHSEKVAIRERDRAAAEFELKCRNKEIKSRKEKAAIEAAEAMEKAKLKTVRQYAEGVFMPAKEITITENTRFNYQGMLGKHILPALGDQIMTEVTPAMIMKLLLDFQRQGYAHGSVIKLYNILNGIFEMAFLDDSIPMNPMLKVKRPAPSKDTIAKQESEKALKVTELDKVLLYVKNEPLKWQVFINLAADTGARRGELCGLQWQDVDWNKGTIIIRRNLQYTPQKGVYETSPKNGKTRVIDIGQETVLLLRRLRNTQADSCISKYVFTQDGTADPMHPQSPTRYFKRFGDQYGIKDFHPHLLRHTSASIAITHGADVVSVSQRLGHSDTAVTLRMYAHANEESIRAAGQAVRDALKMVSEG